MSRYAEDFGPFGDVVWINASHQGPLPKAAIAALEEAVEWKRSPHLLIDSSLFSGIPANLREVLGRLIGSPAEDVILGNSASYGLHLLANGIPWREGDEVLVVKGDFPATILPWLGLAERGVTVRAVEMSERGLTPEDLRAAIGPATKLFCASWVFSFLGIKLDVPSLGAVCQEKGVKFVINGSQAIGTQPFNVGAGHVDAVTCVGFKWLCGPYGTGFCWIEPEWRETMVYNQAYWLAMQTADDLKGGQQMPQIKENLGARKYDVFGTANFFNFVPWTASVDYLLQVGIDNIRGHNEALVKQLLEGLDREQYEFVSPVDESQRTNIVIVSHRDRNLNAMLHRTLTDAGIYVAMRNGHLRFSPHLYNTSGQIDRAVALLNEKGLR